MSESTNLKKLVELENTIGRQMWSDMSSCCYGQHEGGWLASFDFFERLGYNEEVAPLKGMLAVARTCGWLLPADEACIACERHSAIHLDENGRLHNTTGPALEYSDSYKLYMIHGVTVPPRYFDGNLTVTDIDAESNVEVRRVLISDLYGTQKYLSDSNAEILDQVALDDTTALFGLRGAKLIRKQVENDEAIVMLVLIDSTPEADGTRKEYYERVDPECRTCKEAIAWRHKMKPDEYAPAVET